MSTTTVGLFLRHLALSEAVGRLGSASDHELLAVYDSEHGQAAFTELMRRHGPMVLRTCRRVLGRGSDAEDAFQATFVLLARKAGQVCREAAGRLSVGGWLHRVAYQTAVNVLTQSNRRRVRERQAGAMSHPEADPVTEAIWNEVRPILDEELNALPEEPRQLLIACYLQGKTHAQAATELGLPFGSIAWHLEKARALLAKRLTRRGVTLSAALLAVLLSEEASHGAGVPAVLLVHTVEAALTFTAQATGAVSANVARLVKGGLANLVLAATYVEAPEEERPAQELVKDARAGIRLLDVATGKELRRLDSGNGLATGLVFSPDGKVLAETLSATGHRPVVRLWDMASGKRERELAGTCPLFSPDGCLIATRDGLAIRGMVIRFWEAATGKEVQTLRTSEGIRCLALSPDGKTGGDANRHLLRQSVYLSFPNTPSIRCLGWMRNIGRHFSGLMVDSVTTFAGGDAIRHPTFSS